MDDFGSHGVDLYIYDMTQGMARMMSPMFLGKRWNYKHFFIKKFEGAFVYNVRALWVRYYQIIFLKDVRSMEYGIRLW